MRANPFHYNVTGLFRRGRFSFLPICHSASVPRGVGQREGVLGRLISDDAAQRKLILSAARDCLETAQYDEVRQAGRSWMSSLSPWPSLRVSICALWMEGKA
jgi:hypothetical protein